MILFTAIALGFWGILILIALGLAKAAGRILSRPTPSPTDTED